MASSNTSNAAGDPTINEIAKKIARHGHLGVALDESLLSEDGNPKHSKFAYGTIIEFKQSTSTIPDGQLAMFAWVGYNEMEHEHRNLYGKHFLPGAMTVLAVENVIILVSSQTGKGTSLDHLKEPILSRVAADLPSDLATPGSKMRHATHGNCGEVGTVLVYNKEFKGTPLVGQCARIFTVVKYKGAGSPQNTKPCGGKPARVS